MPHDRRSLLIIRDMMLQGASIYKTFLECYEGIAANILADRLRKLVAYGIITTKTGYVRRPKDNLLAHQNRHRSGEHASRSRPADRTGIRVSDWNARSEGRAISTLDENSNGCAGLNELPLKQRAKPIAVRVHDAVWGGIAREGEDSAAIKDHCCAAGFSAN